MSEQHPHHQTGGHSHCCCSCRHHGRDEEHAERGYSLERVLPDLLMDKSIIAISVPQFADMVGISRGKAYELAQNEKIPVKRLDGRYVVMKTDLLEWMGITLV